MGNPLSAGPVGFPATPDELAASPLYNQRWYYSVELLPGMVPPGSYPPDLPMLPRLTMRNVDPSGMNCLDIGTMEGLVPALLTRRGAQRVVAVDAVAHVADRMAALKHYHGVDFEFAEVGLLYDLHRKLAGQGFDFINLSGVLYHVFSPLMVLASVRPLLKRGGIIEVSTNVVYDDGYRMEWNNAGRLQTEANTFWYLSIPLLDYMLRLLRLAPIDCMHIDHHAIDLPQAHVPGLRTGYLSVLCRATDTVVNTADDSWMPVAARDSWEFQGIPDWRMADAQPPSEIRHVGDAEGLVRRPDADCIDVWATVAERPSITSPESPADTHLLGLDDRS